jgi:HK97 family phage major capsid protein
MPPTLEDIHGDVKDIAQNVASYKEAQDTLLAKFADDGDVVKMRRSVEQLETDFKAIGDDIEQKLAKVRRTSWDGRGNYRGVFDNEDQARAFGAFCISRATGLDENTDKLAARAAEVLKKDYPDVHVRAMDSATDGALIQPEFSSRLVRLIEQFGVFEANAFIMPMGGDTLSFLRRTGGMSVFLVGENTAGTGSDPSHGNVLLTAKEWGTLTYVPRTLEEDAFAQIGELIAVEISQAMAEKTDDIGFNGDGTATYFGIVGVRQRLLTVNGVDDGGGLVLGAGNLYSELTLANHEKVMGTLPTYAAGNAKWYCSRLYFFTVMATLMNAAGGVTAGEIEGKRRLLFGGDPVEISQKMPRVTANSQVCCLYGDLRQAATVGRRRGVTIESSRDYKFAERQITYLGTQRKAINVHEVGTATTAGPIVGLITAAS